MPALNTRPRERRHPLVYNKTSECDASPLTPPLSSSDTDPSIIPPLAASNYSASFDASSSSLPSPSHQAFLPSVCLHDEPCPPDLPPAPARPRPHPLTLALQNNLVPNTGASLSVRSDLASHHYYGVDESALDSAGPSLFVSSRRPLPQAPSSPNSPTSPSGSSRQSACGRKFAPHSVKCSLEQLGFYNQHDPFWGQTVLLPDRTPTLDSTASSEEVSPLLLVNYKNSDNVSYEDLLDFGLDRFGRSSLQVLWHNMTGEVVSFRCRLLCS
ncbi:uncharacterized protein LOC143287699 [Babylonia areolata]|uniref:uncharacterized protein LOC143287699 n=1 Tax=Babylonia areolata TaxID=304850 RepID=UPI003FD2C5CC